MARELLVVIRHLTGSPGYALSVIATLALAIGANSAIFSAVHAVLIRPLPIAEPARTVVVSQTDNITGQSVIELTYRHLREWTGAGRTFTHAALMATHNWNAVLENRGEPVRVPFAGVSAGFFDALGAWPIIGRGFDAADDLPAAAPVIVLNYDAWIRRFGGDRSIVGQMLTFDRTPTQVVGVMPSGFDFPNGAEFWAPSGPILTGGGPTPNLANLDTVGVFYVVGRLRPGLDAPAAARELDTIEKNLDAAQPGRLKWGDRTVVEPFRAHLFGAVQPALWSLWAAVAVLLLIACANVSGLLLTRVSLRRREQSLRLALGASRGQLARLWLIEVGVLAFTGGALGLAAASGLTSAIVALAPDDVPRLGEIAVNPIVVAFTFALIVLAALLCALMPVRYAGGARLTDALGDGARGTAGRESMRWRSLLLIAQMAFAVALLIAAGLVVRSFTNLQRIDLGFDPANVLSLNISPRSATAPANEFMRQVIERVTSLPGVESAGGVFLRPLALGPIGQGVRVVLEGQAQTAQAAAQNPTLNYQNATPGFFQTMKVPLRRGRLFSAQDTTETPRVAIVGESTAARLWPGQDPIGKRIFYSAFTPGQKPQWREVIGVVADVRYRGIDEVQLDIYDPALQVGQPARNMLIRAAGADPIALAGLVKSRVRELDPAATVDDVTTMDRVLERASAPWRMSMWMFVLFAGVAFVLAAMGLFSLVSLDVAHRRREFAVRLALGASRRQVLSDVLTAALSKAVAGLMAGLIVGVGAARAMRALLYGVEPVDGQTYTAVVALVAVVVTVATIIPASRASRTDPAALMRD
ncbi:MAG TPA: ABC transporter permease [Vicinamibacterales bacterium]|nr:ABC transporter permease [Vicinamibacterales bacterium]